MAVFLFPLLWQREAFWKAVALAVRDQLRVNLVHLLEETWGRKGWRLGCSQSFWDLTRPEISGRAFLNSGSSSDFSQGQGLRWGCRKINPDL